MPSQSSLSALGDGSSNRTREIYIKDVRTPCAHRNPLGSGPSVARGAVSATYGEDARRLWMWSGL